MRMIDPLKGYRRTLARAAQAAKRFEPATDRQEWRGQYRRIVGERNPGGRIRKNRRIGDRFIQWCIHRMMAEEPNNRRHSARSVTSFSGDSLTQELASILDCGLREVEKAWASRSPKLSAPGTGVNAEFLYRVSHVTGRNLRNRVKG